MCFYIQLISWVWNSIIQTATNVKKNTSANIEIDFFIDLKHKFLISDFSIEPSFFKSTQ